MIIEKALALRARMEALAHGHAAGDTVLKQLAGRLGTAFRDNDYLARWGGEEFLVVARATPHTHAAELAERLRAAVADQPFELDDGRASAGS